MSHIAPGQPVEVSGSVEVLGIPYCVALVSNGTWVVGGPAPPGPYLLSLGVTPDTSSFGPLDLGPAPPPGAFDVLLLAGTCAAPTSIAAADAEGPAPGLVTGSFDVPTLDDRGRLLLVVLVVAAGTLAVRRLR